MVSLPQFHHAHWLCSCISLPTQEVVVFYYFNQLPRSHEGTETKCVRESKNSTSLGVYVQRPMHSVSVLPFKHEQLNASETFAVCLVVEFFSTVKKVKDINTDGSRCSGESP